MPFTVQRGQTWRSEDQLLVLDDLLRIQSNDEDPLPLLAYPRGRSAADFEYFSARQLDGFVDRAAKYYCTQGFQPLVRQVAALLGFSDLDGIVSFLALSRLGFTVLLLSPRLTPEACLKLTQVTEATAFFYSDRPALEPVITSLRGEETSLKFCKVVHRPTWDTEEVDDSTCFLRQKVDRELESQQTSVICHSSGSTGLPKPIYQQIHRLIPPLPEGGNRNDFSTFPIYHSWGKTLLVSAIYHGKCLHLPNAELPLTADNLAAAVEKVQPGVFHLVPYVLKLLGETQRGVEALKACSQVLYAGGSCPEDLGDRLTAEGVFLGSLFGSTETGVIGVSNTRSRDDKFWDYIRIPHRMHEYLQYKPIGDGTFEFIFLGTYPSLSTTDSDDPPGSYHSKDIFLPHPDIQHAWKYLGRLDDRVTLTNGEKVLPLTMEGRVREHPLVREAVVFGIGRESPGLLVFRAESAMELSDGRYVDTIMSTVDDANAKVEKFARISRDMILPMPFDAHIPYADKETIIRARVYKFYADTIDQAYKLPEGGNNGHLSPNGFATHQHILDRAQASGVMIETIDDDFHTAGMDSLQAIQLRGKIVKEIDLGRGTALPQNVVFDTGNVRRLCAFLEAFRSGSANYPNSRRTDMETMTQRYSVYRPHESQGSCMPDKHTVLLTGSTGSLGAHILAKLLANPQVQNIYCPVRGCDGLDRIKSSLQERELLYQTLDPRIHSLPFELDEPELGLDDVTLKTLMQDLTLIIHAAWPVNFQLALPAFKPHIRGLHNLIQLSLNVKATKPARLLFCSSISVAMGTKGCTTISEEPIGSFDQASGSGYSQSKLVSEAIVQKAVHDFGALASNLRIGQIVGDTEHGIWNENEAPPMMIRSALTLGTLPALDTTCSWLPVDTLAASIVELAMDVPAKKLRPVYNLCNPHRFSWTKDFLPALKTAGLPFVATSIREWLEKLRHYAASNEEAAQNCPAVKLIGYYEAAYREREGSDELTLDTLQAQAHCTSLREAPDIIKSGLVAKMLSNWMSRWK